MNGGTYQWGDSPLVRHIGQCVVPKGSLPIGTSAILCKACNVCFPASCDFAAKMWRYSRGRGGVLTGKPLSRIIPLLESSGSEFPSTQLDKYTKVRRTTFKWGCGTAATAADCKSAPSGFPGSSPGTPTIFARVAQSVEHIVGNDEVTGSSPVAGSTSSHTPLGGIFLAV